MTSYCNGDVAPKSRILYIPETQSSIIVLVYYARAGTSPARATCGCCEREALVDFKAEEVSRLQYILILIYPRFFREGFMVNLGNDWDGLLKDEFSKEYYLRLRTFLKESYRAKTIYPDMHDIFNALKFTPYSHVKAVIVGQDPYINPGEAHGLAFSVKPGAKIPPSLINIFKELCDDIGCEMPANGHLERWARQGVMLLNTVLTVEARKSRSHARRGWEQFTDAVMDILNMREQPMVFLLWGRDAQTKGEKITNPKHLILKAAHPSPLAGGRFFGSRHFSKTNAFLQENGTAPIDWGVSV